jgi:hypothetical protein
VPLLRRPIVQATGAAGVVVLTLATFVVKTFLQERRLRCETSLVDKCPADAEVPF